MMATMLRLYVVQLLRLSKVNQKVNKRFKIFSTLSIQKFLSLSAKPTNLS